MVTALEYVFRKGETVRSKLMVELLGVRHTLEKKNIWLTLVDMTMKKWLEGLLILWSKRLLF